MTEITYIQMIQCVGFLKEHGISTGDKVKDIDTENIEKALKMNCRRLHGLMYGLREIILKSQH